MSAQLTDNEIHLLLLLRDGKSNKDIAIVKHVALQTVKNELSHLYDKLGLCNRSQLAVYAERLVNRVILEE